METIDVTGRKVTYTTLNQEHTPGQTATWSEVGEISRKVDGTSATGSVLITDDDTIRWFASDIATSADGAENVYVADLDGDGE